jgi:hypothetical protein
MTLMTPRKILLQLDTDSFASTFDSVVATDAGVDVLLRQGGVNADNVTTLVHGLMFTRGGDKLKNSAIFVGGSNVHDAESVLGQVCRTFFGPVRVSVMFDANGCNTTAVAAVLSALRHVPELTGKTAAVLGGTGPVGLRVSRLLAAAGCQVRVGSRDIARAQKAIHAVATAAHREQLVPVRTTTAAEVTEALRDAQLVFACGAAGITLVDGETLRGAKALQVAVDLNAVPPAGIESISPMESGNVVEGLVRYGAIGVGGLKMKIHKAALQSLFESNDHLLDVDEIFAIGQRLVQSAS